MWVLVVPPHQRRVGWEDILLHSGPHKDSKFRAPCIVSIRLSKCLWILAPMTGTVCAKRRRVLWRNLNVVGISDHYFLFYRLVDITEWTALVSLSALTDNTATVLYLKKKIKKNLSHYRWELFSALPNFTSAQLCRHSHTWSVTIKNHCVRL